jgi:hypothetical protein
MGIAHGRVERFEDDQLVIALPDLELVTRTLADLDVYMGPADRHQGLGLARIRGLANLGAAVRALLAEDGVGTELGRFQGEREGLHPHGVADLDILLTGAYVQGDVTIEHKDKDGHSVAKKVVLFSGTAVWEGCSFAAAVVSGAIAARTVPGQRPARQALEELLDLDPAAAGGGVVPNTPSS